MIAADHELCAACRTMVLRDKHWFCDARGYVGYLKNAYIPLKNEYERKCLHQATWPDAASFGWPFLLAAWGLPAAIVVAVGTAIASFFVSDATADSLGHVVVLAVPVGWGACVVIGLAGAGLRFLRWGHWPRRGAPRVGRPIARPRRLAKLVGRLHYESPEQTILARELRLDRGGVSLRIVTAPPFVVLGDDGRRVHVNAEELWVVAPDVLWQRWCNDDVRSWLADVTPDRHEARALFPYDQAMQLRPAEGQPVHLYADLETEVDAGDGYRTTITRYRAVRGVWLELVGV